MSTNVLTLPTRQIYDPATGECIGSMPIPAAEREAAARPAPAPPAPPPSSAVPLHPAARPQFPVVQLQQQQEPRELTIYTLCVDQERGVYLAFVHGTMQMATSHTSIHEAVGKLMMDPEVQARLGKETLKVVGVEWRE